MQRKLIGAACVAVLLILAAFLAASAKAGDNPSPPTVTGSSVSFQQTHDKSVAVSTGSASGKIQVRYTNPNGLSKAQKAGAEKCLVAADDNKPGHGKVCGHIKIGTPFTNSGICISTGRFCMFTDHVKPGETFYLINGQWYKGKCGNKVWINRPHPPGPVLPHYRVTVVQYFTYRAKVTVHAKANAQAWATASCVQNGVSASAMGYGSGSATAVAQASASARTRAEAVNLATSQATANLVKQQGKAKASALTQASSNAKAQAVVSCTGSGGSTTPASAPFSCSLSVYASKSDPETANASVAIVNGPPTSITYNWGNGSPTTGGLSATHTYPTPPASTQRDAGSHYTISATANFADGSTVTCSGTQDYFIPAPLPPSAPNGGGSGPPPPPAG